MQCHNDICFAFLNLKKIKKIESFLVLIAAICIDALYLCAPFLLCFAFRLRFIFLPRDDRNLCPSLI